MYRCSVMYQECTVRRRRRPWPEDSTSLTFRNGLEINAYVMYASQPFFEAGAHGMNAETTRYPVTTVVHT